jgi:hypothetical protein
MRSAPLNAVSSPCQLAFLQPVPILPERQALCSTHGYRFVADLDDPILAETTIARTQVQAALSGAGPARRWKPRTPHYHFAGVIVLLVACAIILLRLRGPPPPVAFGTIAVLPPDNCVENEEVAG